MTVLNFWLAVGAASLSILLIAWALLIKPKGWYRLKRVDWLTFLQIGDEVKLNSSSGGKFQHAFVVGVMPGETNTSGSIYLFSNGWQFSQRMLSYGVIYAFKTGRKAQKLIFNKEVEKTALGKFDLSEIKLNISSYNTKR